jgi:GntR family transcriptional regulator, transcriptional repressor for pyruvate dehydrogenase complex
VPVVGWKTAVERPIRTTNVPSAVAGDLRDQIHSGKRAPGDRLPGNRELAAIYGVSMGSIREAISMLSSEGLIETRAGRGTYVARGSGRLVDAAPPANRSGVPLDRKYVEELIEAREILELQLVALAAQRASADEVARLSAIVGQMEEAVTNPSRYSTADVAFHLALAEAAGNRVLSQAMANIRTLLKREMELSAEVGARRHGDLRFSADSHRRVLNAIEVGDADLATSEMFDIMSRHHEFVLGLYAGTPEPSRKGPR